ncbi:F-box/WD-40 repeat-containing protein At5g21040 [Phragmites australis]|uniref:F-box/WD-40 repeat-containing protein At5g21040 n=1 Tax=Phragmites australis TaxID=29695 RepID=UPI002D78EA75|nr:F-box/WD-40 repeat-containing protein At5g21040 [Phragmites australis]XP_062226760.1 F-box/WD-40 repeat-containing protein At5g21040 [Phragmites australis]XP_062226761.1 F-box/WD-40 repeat-containing protein At5g21040 [Phragmites australis]
MAFDCNKEGGVSSPENYSRICTQGTLIQENPLTHCGKAKNWKSLNRLNYQKSSYGSIPGDSDPKQDDGTSDEAIASICGIRSFTDLPAALVCEVLEHLDAKELGIVSCVSTLLHSLATDHQGWKKFYCERWGLPNLPITLNGPSVLGGPPDGKSWRTFFVEREFQSKSFMGKFDADVLCGHSEDVRAVFLLASTNLIFTGGRDSVIRMWNMEEGLLIDTSRPLGCTIRAIAADNRLLVTGGTNAFIQCWRAVEGNPFLFQISGSGTYQDSEFCLWGHEGPVTCLALDSLRIYSGSWDMTVRVWDRTQMECVQKFMHADWVWALAPHGNTVASTAGRDAYVWDIRNGELTSIVSNAHVGNAYSLARTHLPGVLFTGGEDGAVRLFKVSDVSDDEDIKPSATWVPHSGPVHSLAFEYPWLVSASSDGRIALIDLRKLLTPQNSSKHPFNVKSFDASAIKPPQRMLHGCRCELFSIAIGADRIVCGGEDGSVKVWNFSEALEIEKRAQALKSLRQENRMRRKKAQVEMNANGRRSDQCSIAMKRNQLKGDKSVTWHSKHAINEKAKS